MELDHMKPFIRLALVYGFVFLFEVLFCLIFVGMLHDTTENGGENDTAEIDAGAVPAEVTGGIAELYPVRLVRVVDGDTVVVSWDGEERYVRLIGVDAPESVHPDEALNSAEGVAASEFTKEYLSEYDTLYLQLGVKPEDKYGRLLAYVWLTDDINPFNEEDVRMYMFNAILLSNRMAEPVSYEPNTMYAYIFGKIAGEVSGQ